MIKKRRGAAKAALARQRAELRRNAKGKQFIGDDGGSAAARQAERAKVLQMQANMRAAAERAREAEPVSGRGSRIGAAVRLVRDTTKLAVTVAGLPLRVATAAAGLPIRVVSAMWLRPREA